MKHASFLLALPILFSCMGNKSADTSISHQEAFHSPTDTLKFTSGIRSIYQDTEGNYWFGSDREGVARYDGNSFSYYSIEDGLAATQVRSIQEDSRGTIWFGTANGVSKFDGDSITTIQPSEGAAEWQKGENDLWFTAGRREGVFRYDGQNLYYLAFPVPQSPTTGSIYALTSLSEDVQHQLWFGTYLGVFQYDGVNMNLINNESLGFNEGYSLHIRSVLADSQNRLWIGNNGIGVLLKEGDSSYNFSEAQRLIHPASRRNGSRSAPGTLEHVFVIVEDSAGNIWFSDRDAGIWKYDGENMTNYLIQNGPTIPFAQFIFEDREGVLWFGTADGKVYTLEGERFERKY